MEYETEMRSRDVQAVGLIGGLALGALAMYLADPSQGRRRRALLRDQVNSASHKTSRLVGRTIRDARHRFTGLQAEAMRLLSPKEAKPIDDHVLEARVRSRLGRSMSNLHQIEVSAHQGVVTLMGDFDSDELSTLLELVQAIPGVDRVRHQARTFLIQTNPVRSMFSLDNALWIVGVVGSGLLAWYALGGKSSSEKTMSKDTDSPLRTDKKNPLQVQPSVVAGKSPEAEQSGKSSMVSILH